MKGSPGDRGGGIGRAAAGGCTWLSGCAPGLAAVSAEPCGSSWTRISEASSQRHLSHVAGLGRARVTANHPPSRWIRVCSHGADTGFGSGEPFCRHARRHYGVLAAWKWIKVVRQGVTRCSCRCCSIRGCALRPGPDRSRCLDVAALAVSRRGRCGHDHRPPNGSQHAGLAGTGPVSRLLTSRGVILAAVTAARAGELLGQLRIRSSGSPGAPSSLSSHRPSQALR